MSNFIKNQAQLLSTTKPVAPICPAAKADDLSWHQQSLNEPWIGNDSLSTTRKKFSAFLVVNGIYGQFMNNYLNHPAEDFTLVTFMDNHEPGLWIREAFNGGKTKQGFDFWEKYSTKWLEFAAK